MSAAKTDRVWRRGPPPHVGWWNASVCKSSSYWRWWNGESWSGPAMNTDSAVDALDWARSASVSGSDIEWSDFYPANARVPRLDPTDGDWTFNVDGSVPVVLKKGVAIERVYRDGSKFDSLSGSTDALLWRLDGNHLDIVAWRLKPGIRAR